MGHDRRGDVLSQETLEHLASFADIEAPTGDAAMLAARLADLLPEADALLSGWGAPRLTQALLASAPRLKIVAHAAGSVKGVVPLEAYDRGMTVCHAATFIADAVAEHCLMAALVCLRQAHRFDRAMRDGTPWHEATALHKGRLLQGKLIGLLGCGYVARKLIRLLAAFDAPIIVYDPYLGEAEAELLGVARAALPHVLSAPDVVSVHLPITPETRHLIGRTELRLIRDGTVFLNSARAWSVDQEALLDELRTGRFWAALDVFEPEPLPDDSPFRRLENVLLTPHRAGYSIETNRMLGREMVRELERFFRGEPLRHAIAREQYPIMA